jgi:hypothetical protein
MIGPCLEVLRNVSGFGFGWSCGCGASGGGDDGWWAGWQEWGSWVLRLVMGRRAGLWDVGWFGAGWWFITLCLLPFARLHPTVTDPLSPPLHAVVMLYLPTYNPISTFLQSE